MATLNKLMLIGRLTDNPEPPRVLPNSGSTVVKFRFAVGKSKKRPDGSWENDPNPLYLDCEAYSRADVTRQMKLTDLIVQYCAKGSQIYVEGRLQYETWDDKNNPGQKRSKHKMVVESIQFLDAKGAGESAGGGGEDRASYSPARAPAGSGRPAQQPPPRGGGYSDGPPDQGDGDSDIPF